MAIKILITDDQRLMREGLKTILDLQKDMVVVGLAENGKDALDKLSEIQPDIILMDIRMPVMDGVECTKAIKQRYPDIKVIILTTFDDDEFIIEALKNGAVGYILKDLSTQKLVAAIRAAYEGNSIMQPEITAKMVAHMLGSIDSFRAQPGADLSAASAAYKPLPDSQTGSCSDKDNREQADCALDDKYKEGLTDREKDVLALVGKGLTNVEIAKKLYISEGTVKNYISSLYSKLELNDRSKLTVYAIENKYI